MFQNSAIAADFASRVAKAASESGDNPPSTSAQEHNITTPIPSAATPSIANVKPQLNSNKEPSNTQCNNAPVTPIQSIVPQSPITDNQSTAQETCQVKVEAKPVAPVAKEWPRNDTKQQTVFQDEHQTPPLTNKDNIPSPQSSPIPPLAATESEAKSSTSQGVATVPVPPPTETTAPPSARESFSSTKTTTSSPPRRKSHQQQQSAAQVVATATTASDSYAATAAATAVPAVTPVVPTPVLSAPVCEPRREQERKLSEKSAGSRGTTPTPISNQTEQQQHLQKNGETVGDKSEEIKADQKSPDGEFLFYFYLAHSIKVQLTVQHLFPIKLSFLLHTFCLLR